MYQEHFGFRAPPFGLTPDTGFFFVHATHQDALNMLLVALRSGEGFLKVTGEIGLGKTTVCRMLLHTLARDEKQSWRTAYLPNPTTSREALLRMVASELDCGGTHTLPDAELLLERIQQQLLDHARAGARTVLVVDEAQAMTDEALEALRLLTNLETEHDKLLQVVLFGQPELDQRLEQKQLRQLRQRISFSHVLEPLDRSQFRAYVRHRLRVVGGQEDLFPQRVLDLLGHGCGGVPRLGNILCHKALLAAYGPGAAKVSGRHAMAAIVDTPGARFPAWRWPLVMVRQYPAIAAWGLAIGVASALILTLIRP